MKNNQVSQKVSYRMTNNAHRIIMSLISRSVITQTYRLKHSVEGMVQTDTQLLIDIIKDSVECNL